jgi:hypothetical protein
MTEERLTSALRDAVCSVPVPRYPDRIAERSAEARAPRSAGGPVRALAIGGAVLLAAVAAGVPTAYFMSAPERRTLERLLGHPVGAVRSYDVPKLTLEEARRRTTFPIVVPSGIRVLDAQPAPNDDGVTLILTVDGRSQVMLTEVWARHAKRSPLDGIGIHRDGSIRRFNVRRWRIGEIAYTLPMFDSTYHAFADRIEAATYDAVRGRHDVTKRPGP